MISKEIIRKALGDKITDEKFKDLVSSAQKKKIPLIDYLINNKIAKAEELYSLIANQLNIPFVDFKNKSIDKKLFDLLPESIVQTHHVVIFDRDEKKNIIKVATTEPEDLQTIDFIKKKTGAEIEVHLTTPDSISNVIKQYHKGIKEEFASFTGSAPLTGKNIKTDKLSFVLDNVPIVKIVDTVLEYAIFEGASDIHIEPEEKDIVIRYRIDGVLKDVMTLPKEIQAGILARIKVLSNLKLDEHRLPQDGRFKVETDEVKVAFRVSVIPVYDGEKVVMRLLDASKQLLTLEQLGIQKQPLEAVKRNIKKPHGIVLVTGPTGCGKTTTLYTILNILNTTQVNILTIEDPIEYRIARVNQSQINPKIGFTFASGLRAMLRQDPNIIMVGEIRDQETAEIASHAAMTGHLVLSTLHTNDATGAMPRLAEMGVPSFLVASTTNLIIAQRLVRKICPHCIQTYTLDKDEIAEIEKQFKMQDVIEFLTTFGEVEQGTAANEITFYRGKGCIKCAQRGYKGRIGIFEVLEVTDTVSDAILKTISKEEMEKLAHAQGMITMAQDGFIKAKQGITTLEEIIRVTKE